MNPEMWLGGRNYLRNLLMAFDKLPDPDLVPVVVTGKLNIRALADFPSTEIIRTKMMDRGSFSWFARKFLVKALGQDRLLHGLLTRSGIQMISHGGPLVPCSDMASVGWIADFQHIYLPSLFSSNERRARDREFLKLCSSCERIIVSSDSALQDLYAFAPEYAAKGEVLHFVASPSQPSEIPLLTDLQQRYCFSGPYFLLPNQFWAHKNHRIVITALSILKKRGRHVVVLATGATHDHRQPKFFGSLIKYAAECGVLNMFRVLGAIPYEDLSGLMNSAIALVNPSKFEGWSTSVEESKSLGKRILLSDIPVHREQAPPLGTYFGADDADTLADYFWQTLVNFDSDLDDENREKARRTLNARQIDFALRWQEILTVAQSKRLSSRE